MLGGETSDEVLAQEQSVARAAALLEAAGETEAYLRQSELARAEATRDATRRVGEVRAEWLRSLPQRAGAPNLAIHCTVVVDVRQLPAAESET